MNIEVHCPNCKTTLSIPAEAGGDFHSCSSCGEQMLVPLAPGKKIGNFTLIRKIGEGGMGMVYLAEQKPMGRNVALKVLAPRFTHDALFRQRFEKEIKLQAALSHPNIATAYDAGHDGPLYYLAMEYIEGRGLHTIINKLGMLREKTALRITRQIAIAMSYAWKSSKIIHRDIKPSNIIVDDNWNVKILDMGVSKSLKEMADHSNTEYVVGTPQYMAPEQMTSEDLDHRADIYSLGATLYHMVTGRPPYDETTLAATVSKMKEAPAPHPKEFNSDISSGCAQLIRTMMACAPAQRYAYWSSLVADLSRVLSGQKPAMDSPPRNESFVAYSPRLISSDAPKSSKLAEVASRAAASTVQPKPEGVNLPAVIIGLLSLLIALMIYATLSQLSPRPTPTLKADGRTTPDKPPPQTSAHAVTDEAPDLVTAETDPTDTFTDKEDILLELETLYQFIVQRMDEDPDNVQAHLKSIRHLRIDADFFGFSKYLILADELEAQNRQHMKIAVHRLMDNLTQKAENAWRRGEYAEAEKIFRDYTGPLARPTYQQRIEKAESYNHRQAEMERQKRNQEQQIEDTITRLTIRVVDHILDGISLAPMAIALEEALISFGETEQTRPLQKLNDQVHSITMMDDIILQGFSPHINKGVISISTSRGSQFVKVRRIEQPNLFVEKQLEAGIIEIPIHVNDLSIREKIIRLNGLPEDERAFMIGILAIQSNHPEAAISYLSENDDALSQMLVAYLKPDDPAEDEGPGETTAPTPGKSPPNHSQPPSPRPWRSGPLGKPFSLD